MESLFDPKTLYIEDMDQFCIESTLKAKGTSMDDSQRRTWFGSNQLEMVTKLRRLANDLEEVRDGSWLPNRTTLVTDWFLGQRAVPCIIGRPQGHPTIGDGNPMVSTELFYLDADSGYARTFSRWYRLRDPLINGRNGHFDAGVK